MKKSGTTADSGIEQNYTEVVDMHPVIETYREVYGNDLEERLGLDRDTLPVAMAIGTLLNPVFGIKSKIVGSGLMSPVQFIRARAALLHKMQDIIEARLPMEAVTEKNKYDSEDEELPDRENVSHKRAEDELKEFERFKKKRYHPTFSTKARVLSGTLEDGEKEYTVYFGAVKERGDNLPSGKNLADYFDHWHRMNLLKLFSDHTKLFPTLWIIVQREASRRIYEVSCERFFSLSGYVSSPRRTRLGVRNYERLAMLASIINQVYVDPQWVADEYLRRCKNGAWKKENTVAALKCWNFERMMDAQDRGLPEPKEMTLEDFLQEEKVIQESGANEGNDNTEDVSCGEGDGDSVEEI